MDSNTSGSLRIRWRGFVKTVMNFRMLLTSSEGLLRGVCRDGVRLTGVSFGAIETCQLGTCRLQRTGAKCLQMLIAST